MNIPEKPKGGSLDIRMLVNHQFPYMRRPIMAGQIMPGVAYDYAVKLIAAGKAEMAKVQTDSKVNEDGTTGETNQKKSFIEKLGLNKKEEPVTKDVAKK